MDRERFMLTADMQAGVFPTFVFGDVAWRQI